MRSTKRPKRSAAPKKAGGGALEGQTLVQVMGWPTRSRKKLAKQWKACGATVLDTAEWKEEPEQATACVFFDAIDATDDATSIHHPSTIRAQSVDLVSSRYRV